jgi:hypothetical protein
VISLSVRASHLSEACFGKQHTAFDARAAKPVIYVMLASHSSETCFRSNTHHPTARRQACDFLLKLSHFHFASQRFQLKAHTCSC